MAGKSPFCGALRELQSHPSPTLTDAEIASNLDDQKDEEVALSSIFDNNFALLLGVDLTSPVTHRPGPAARGAAAAGCSRDEFEFEVSIEVKSADARVFLAAPDDVAGEEAALMYYEIEHLPLVKLRWRNVPTYPSHTPPAYRVYVEWLSNAQIQRLEEALRDIYREAPGCGIIFRWHEMLSSELLPFLGLLPSFAVVSSGDGLQAVAYTPDDTGEAESPASAGGEGGEGGGEGGKGVGAGVMIGWLMEYDESARLRNFQDALHVCGVCLEEKPGHRHTHLECDHAFCTDCLRSIATLHITEGTLEGLKCSAASCSAPFSRPVIRQLVDDELWQRYVRLHHAKVLDKMAATHHMRYCPRCDPVNMPAEAAAGGVRTQMCKFIAAGSVCRFGKECKFAHVPSELPPERPTNAMPCFPASFHDFMAEREDANEEQRALQMEEDLYICERCGYNFCGFCYSAYHPGVKCLTRCHELQTRMMKLQARTSTQAQQEHSLKQELARLRAEILSAAEIAATSRACPSCRIGVFKTGGCNHMTCACGCHFCWTCGKDISGLPGGPYSHYGAGCVVFHDLDVADAQDARGRQRVLRQYRNHVADIARDRRHLISECPSCRALVCKDGSNNHVVCHNCNVSFCFLCRQRLKGIKGHFSAVHPQHD